MMVMVLLHSSSSSSSSSSVLVPVVVRRVSGLSFWSHVVVVLPVVGLRASQCPSTLLTGEPVVRLARELPAVANTPVV